MFVSACLCVVFFRRACLLLMVDVCAYVCVYERVCVCVCKCVCSCVYVCVCGLRVSSRRGSWSDRGGDDRPSMF